jgi:hypothetical protein
LHGDKRRRKESRSGIGVLQVHLQRGVNLSGRSPRQAGVRIYIYLVPSRPRQHAAIFHRDGHSTCC